MYASNEPIFLGLGGNLPSSAGSPRATCGAALEMLADADIEIVARSPWYESAPVPISDQPWFVNGVVQIRTRFEPAALLALLLDVEQRMGRQRGVANAARTVDIDLIAYGGRVSNPGDEDPILPHPRLSARAFVVLPLKDLAPGWHHPASGMGIREMAEMLPAEQIIRKMADADGLFGTEWPGKGSGEHA